MQKVTVYKFTRKRVKLIFSTCNSDKLGTKLIPKLIVRTSGRLRRYHWVFLPRLTKIKKHSTEGSLHIEGKLFSSDYYYLWMSFQALGKLKQRFAAALAKPIQIFNPCEKITKFWHVSKISKRFGRNKTSKVSLTAIF